MDISRTMIINDIHIPFHNSRLLTVAGGGMLLDILEDTKCERIIINGDLGDFYNWNRYGQHPNVTVDMQTELYLIRLFLKNLRKRFPSISIVFLLGNHEVRFENWIIEKSKPLHGLLKLEDQLCFDEYNIEWYPYQFKYEIEESRAFVTHSPSSYGVNGARTSMLSKLDETWIYGCTHREQVAHSTGGSGKGYSSFFNGWLGSVDETPQHAQVFSYRKGQFGWQNCFIMVNTINRKESHITQHSIRDHKVVVDGVVYDYSKEPILDELEYYEE